MCENDMKHSYFIATCIGNGNGVVVSVWRERMFCFVSFWCDEKVSKVYSMLGCPVVNDII